MAAVADEPEPAAALLEIGERRDIVVGRQPHACMMGYAHNQNKVRT